MSNFSVYPELGVVFLAKLVYRYRRRLIRCLLCRNEIEKRFDIHNWFLIIVHVNLSTGFTFKKPHLFEPVSLNGSVDWSLLRIVDPWTLAVQFVEGDAIKNEIFPEKFNDCKHQSFQKIAAIACRCTTVDNLIGSRTNAPSQTAIKICCFPSNVATKVIGPKYAARIIHDQQRRQPVQQFRHLDQYGQMGVLMVAKVDPLRLMSTTYHPQEFVDKP